MMKKIVIILPLVFISFMKAQSKSILDVNEIGVLESFLKKSKSKNHFLQKAVEQKIKRLRKKASFDRIREEVKRIKEKEIALVKKTISNDLQIIDEFKSEFEQLISNEKNNHTEKTLNLLNAFFNNDPYSENAILLIENKSSCNMILSINGMDKHRIAIPHNEERVVTLKKGEYELLGKVCEKNYQAVKKLDSNLKITLQ